MNRMIIAMSLIMAGSAAAAGPVSITPAFEVQAPENFTAYNMRFADDGKMLLVHGTASSASAEWGIDLEKGKTAFVVPTDEKEFDYSYGRVLLADTTRCTIMDSSLQNKIEIETPDREDTYKFSKGGMAIERLYSHWSALTGHKIDYTGQDDAPQGLDNYPSGIYYDFEYKESANESYLLDRKKNKRVFTIPGKAEEYKITRNLKYWLGTPDNGKTMVVYNIAQGKKIFEIPNVSWSQYTESPDSEKVLIDHRTSSARFSFWDLASGKKLLNTGDEKIDFEAITPDGRYAAFRDYSHMTFLRDIASGERAADFPTKIVSASGPAFSPDGKLAALLDGERGRLYVYSLNGVGKAADKILITNVSIQQQGGKFDIYYDLSDDADITIYIGGDKNKRLAGVSGDAGKDVRGGTRKHIVWDAEKDFWKEGLNGTFAISVEGGNARTYRQKETPIAYGLGISAPIELKLAATPSRGILLIAEGIAALVAFLFSCWLLWRKIGNTMSTLAAKVVPERYRNATVEIIGTGLAFTVIFMQEKLAQQLIGFPDSVLLCGSFALAVSLYYGMHALFQTEIYSRKNWLTALAVLQLAWLPDTTGIIVLFIAWGGMFAIPCLYSRNYLRAALRFIVPCASLSILVAIINKLQWQGFPMITAGFIAGACVYATDRLLLGRKTKAATTDIPTAPKPSSNSDTVVDPRATVVSAKATAPASTALAGGFTDKYEMLREIGRGGMGIVYEARHKTLGRRVAVKKMRDELALNVREKRRFLGEARRVAELHHHNIVDIYDIFEEKDGVLLVFEYVEGKTCSELLDNAGKLPCAQAVRISQEVCAALKYAHGRRIIHRDIKPTNIMVTTELVKVMDFGIAREAKDTMSRLTGLETSGTFAYMAPEQHLGIFDERADLYSLGVTLYELTTGELPFRGPDFIVQKREMAFRHPRELCPEMTEQLEAVIIKCLMADKEKRWQSVQELAAALTAAKA